jgi:hypothetical protein
VWEAVAAGAVGSEDATRRLVEARDGSAGGAGVALSSRGQDLLALGSEKARHRYANIVKFNSQKGYLSRSGQTMWRPCAASR